MVDPQWIIEQHKKSDVLLKSQKDEFKKYIDDVKRTSKFYGRNLNNEEKMEMIDRFKKCIDSINYRLYESSSAFGVWMYQQKMKNKSKLHQN